MMSRSIAYFIFGFLLASFNSCTPDEIKDETDLSSILYNPQSYIVTLPPHFPKLEVPDDNQLTIDGVELGRHLFYDPILSRDSTMSCSSCHLPEKGFADGKSVSTGIDGIAGKRSSMSLINVGFIKSGLFWDGRVQTLEDQALVPVEDPIELHHSWPEVVKLLQKHPKYPTMFRKAFGITSSDQITKELAAKALAQFERILISSNSKFDRVKEGKEIFTDEELIGFGIFFDDDPDLPDGECGHCHNTPLGTSDNFFNNGLQTASNLDAFLDLGRGKVTSSRADNGKFRAPTLRNIEFSAPYMHNGTFNTLDEVLAFYKSGGNDSPNADPLLHPLQLNDFHVKALKAFVLTLRDTTFYTNPSFTNPHN